MVIKEPAVPYSCVKDETIQELHKRNNATIKHIIQTFQEENNLNSKDFVVIGSSCASYMNYLILKTVRDVDIHVFDRQKRERCIKTHGVDLIKHMLLPSEYKNRLVEKDGYYFLSKEDFLVNACSAGLLKTKGKDILYSRIILLELEMSGSEFYNMMTAVLPSLEKCIDFPEVYDIISSRINILNTHLSDKRIARLKESTEKLLECIGE